jgi:hypothetical protein
MTEQHFDSRFKGPSDAIDMEKLERETQKLLFLGLLVAVSFHAALGSYFIFKRTEVTVVKPPTMELVIRRPRMTKPFEFKKQRVKEREYQRKEIAERKPTAEVTTKSVQEGLMGSVATYEMTTEMNIQTGEVFIPQGVEIEMATTREPEKQISMKEEMITLDDLDTGQYKAMIIQDPQDKQSIKGFIYISTLWGAQLEPAYKRAVIQLSDAVNRYTNITSKVDKHLFIDSSRIFDSPLVFLCVDGQFELTEIEARNFGDYLRKGGFAVFDNGEPDQEYSAAEASLRRAYRDALGSDAKFLPIPNNHGLYHCFFDFNDGPPQGSEVDTHLSLGRSNSGESVAYQAHRTTMNKQVLYLEGISIDNRLCAIYSDKGYADKWEDETNNEPQLKMGVNMVVFALTQEGSISQQKMDFFSSVQ